MKKEEQAQKLEQIIKDNAHYTNLEVNEDFIFWKENTFSRRLEVYLDAILTAKDNEEGDKQALRNLRRYQDLKLMIDDSFKVAKSTEGWAKEALKKLKNLMS